MIIKINTKYAPFLAPVIRDDTTARYELAKDLDKIFREICSDIRHSARTKGEIINANGNNVGYWSLEEGE